MLDPAAARTELLRRWLAAFGPGTMTDVTWWTGWTVRHAEAALAGAGAVEVELDEGTGFVAHEDLEPAPECGGWVALLPALDPTVMGWKERAWYLGDHQAQLFDRNGNAGPTIWWCGRVVGGWGQRPDGSVVYRLTQDLGSDGETHVSERARALEAWLGGVRVTPRFPTPLFRDLSR